MERQSETSYLRAAPADSFGKCGDRPLSGQWGRYFGTLDTSVGTLRNSWPVYGSGISTSAGLSTQNRIAWIVGSHGRKNAMTRRTKQALQAVPLLLHESVFLGIDVGKTRHVAGFVSKTLLERHQRFEACPALAFENSREGFAALAERMRTLAPLEHYTVLLEKTGHYHKALQQFLHELDVPVYVMHVQERLSGMMKTDKRDALGLANILYNQLALGVQVANKAQLV